MLAPLKKSELRIIAFSLFMLTSGMSLIGPLMPIYITQLGNFAPRDAARWAGLIEGITFIMSAIFSPIWGMLGDRFGRKSMVLRAFFGMSITMALLSLCQTPLQMFFVRMVHGCIAGAISASIALVSTRVEEKEMGSTLGLLHSFILAGTVGGPFIGGLLADAFGFQLCFFITSAILLCCGALIAFYIPATQENKPKNGHHYTLSDNFRYYFGNRQLRLISAVLLLSQMARMGQKPIVPLFISSLSSNLTCLPTVVGSVFGLSGLAAALSVKFWGKRADKYGFRATLLLTLSGAAFFTLGMPLSQAIWQIALFHALAGLFNSGTTPLLQSLIALNSEKTRRGCVYGTVMIFQMLGNAAGPMLGGVVSEQFGFRLSLFLLGLLFIVGWFLVRFKMKEKESDYRVADAISESEAE
ncbi:MAG: hypothetical protein A2293_01030 [Elusimicrobia bacterium RIFOXYB2_FULL_49_7]|nr:MAG: hypothetical protein A2293_01030 [Elusimicrobia bacterium RIFOXYB2_FULL_49_7]